MRWARPTWGHFAGAVLIFAGVAKLLAFPDFAQSVRTWTMFPVWMQTTLVVVLPPFEIGLGTALVHRPRSAALLVGFTATMVVFTAAYSLQLFVFGRPDCACLALLAAYSKDLSDSPFVIGRNIALASVGVAGFIRAKKLGSE